MKEGLGVIVLALLPSMLVMAIASAMGMSLAGVVTVGIIVGCAVVIFGLMA